VVGALGIAGLMVLQKHLVRHNDWIMMSPAIAAMLLVLGWRVKNGRRADSLVVGLGAVALSLGLWTSGVVGRVAARVGSGAASTVSLLKGDLRIDSEKLRQAKYGSGRFVSFAAESDVLGKMKSVAGIENIPEFYAIGDGQILYLLARQRPPYLVTDYDASPIFSQRQIVEWIRRERPEYAIWRFGDLSFDAVPRIVRDPLIYSEVVDAFVPVTDVGSYSLLRRRKPEEPIAIDWWRDRLGSYVSYGWLPRASRPRPPCNNAGDVGCVDVLELTLTRRVDNPSTATADIEVDGRVFTVQFTIDPAYLYYRIPLARLWFWDMAVRHNLPHRLTFVSVENNEGWQMKLSSQAGEKILY
jgi:hypothetical protein